MLNYIPSELFTAYPEEGGLRPNDVISLAGDGQMSFTLLRNLKTVLARCSKCSARDSPNKKGLDKRQA